MYSKVRAPHPETGEVQDAWVQGTYCDMREGDMDVGFVLGYDDGLVCHVNQRLVDREVGNEKA